MRFHRVLVAILLFMSAGWVHALPGPCTFANAHYTLSSDKSFTLTFPSTGPLAGWISNVALEVSHGPGNHYWFLFDAGSARYINLISTENVMAKGWTPPTDDKATRPLGEIHFFGWHDQYKFLETIPNAGTDAPAYIFLPDLAQVLAYRAAPRVVVQQGVFLLDHCK